MTVVDMAAGVKSYRHIPTRVRAVRVTEHNLHDVAEWCGGEVGRYGDGPVLVLVPTDRGQVQALPGSFVIEGVFGEFYPVSSEVFANSYDAETNGP